MKEIPTRNIVAAILSLFVPGLGQIVQGRVGIGILMLVLAVFSWFVLMGWVVHIWSVLDALFHGDTVTS